MGRSRSNAPHGVSGLSPSVLTLPLGRGSYPFALSEQEKALGRDDWAWLFLRLNPQYQHDFRLWKSRDAAWEAVPGGFTPNIPLAMVWRPELLKSWDGSGTPPPAPKSRWNHLKGLDSRYFVVDGEALGNTPHYLHYKPISLEDYLKSQKQPIPLEKIRVRDFDVARDYGIGAWLDPATSPLPPLSAPKDVVTPSWFHNVNAPIWQAGSWAFREPKLYVFTLEDGQTVGVGQYEKANKLVALTKAYKDGVELTGDQLPQLKSGQPLPRTSSHLTATQFQFLVCLDGYVRPQLAVAFSLAEQFKSLHKEYHPASVQRGAGSIESSIEVVTAIDENKPGRALFKTMTISATRQRRNWRIVTLDVAEALGTRRDQIESELIWHQKKAKDTLSFPVRKRPRDEGAEKNNALKRALCLMELHRSKLPGKPLSQKLLNEAIHCADMPAYYQIRGEEAPKHLPIGTFNLDGRAGHADQIREGLKLGKNMVLGWFEYVASRQFED